MRQHARFKAAHPGCVLLFRMGDFYEAFDDDAVLLHKTLGLTLTKRTEGLPMAGVPYHQLENYLRRLVAQGIRVAVCDQIQDPKEAKGIVERAVTRVITPGTIVDEALLDESASNRIAAVASDTKLGDAQAGRVGVAIVEVSTGLVSVIECSAERLLDELAPRGVQEILHAEVGLGGGKHPMIERVAGTLGSAVTPRAGWHFRPAEAVDAIKGQYGVSTLAGFALRDDEPATWALGALIRYLQETQTPGEGTEQPARVNLGSSKAAVLGRRATLAHLRPPRREEARGRCVLDAVSLRSLEIERTLRAGATPAAKTDGSLVGLFVAGPDAPKTSMGKRLVREWLCRPLGEIGPIRARHRAVAQLASDRELSARLVEALDGVQDVARIGGRLALGRATPRDLVALGRSLERVRAVRDVIAGAAALATWHGEIERVGAALEPIAKAIVEVCVDAPPAHLREGGLFKDGVDGELDEARLLQRDAGSWLVQYQAKLLEQYDLPGLKVGFNSVFGYFIELTASQAKLAPAAFTRKQTLKNAERYITPELKAFEDKVTTAEARAVAREQALFDGLCTRAAERLADIAAFGEAVAALDALACFASKAVRRGWCEPAMSEEPVLAITQGRHPVLEELLGDRFVPNDVELGGPHAGLALITGPNMAGKSTFIRTAALLVVLAHAGSFVPAASAEIGVCDRVFTRVGADDALHAGQSTFMVEMTETATILNHAGPRSLVILDEIGRGTSTLDGLSLAWAIAEFLAKGTEAATHQGTEGQASGAVSGPRTLFATHYHELTELEERLAGRVRNLHVSVREWGEEIVFLHRIVPGRTSQSYGVHVAKLAGLPREVVERAHAVLSAFAVTHGMGQTATAAVPEAPRKGEQLPLFTEYVPHPAVDSLRELKIEAMSPMQAFDELRRLKELTQ